MVNISFSHKHAEHFVTEDEIKLFQSEVDLHRKNIYHRKGKGSDFLGWVDLPSSYDEKLLSNIEADAAKIREQSDVAVVIGIGGSYLGTRAICEALEQTPFADHNNDKAQRVRIVYAGHHLDEDYLHELLSWLDTQSYSLVVISKSGTTTEPAIAFRLLRAHIEKKYGRKNAAERVFAVTDVSRGALKKLAYSEGYKSYVIPDDVGGRFSVLSPVGLLPIAIAGFDIRQLLAGAKNMAAFLEKENNVIKNHAACYAVVRNILYNKGKTTELLAAYKPSLVFFTEWWKQLYGESEGKDGKGIFPAGVNFTTDLHSMGQYIQDGLKNFFETVIKTSGSKHSVIIPQDNDDLDGLNYLAGKRVGYVNEMAARGTMMAHVEGKVPNLEINIPKISEETLGELIYFFEMACAISGYILDVNPFDQPGVEAYKKNMFALLGKP